MPAIVIETPDNNVKKEQDEVMSSTEFEFFTECINGLVDNVSRNNSSNDLKVQFQEPMKPEQKETKPAEPAKEITPVWPLLKNWLLNPEEKAGVFRSIISKNGKVRQQLFERDKRALQKYNSPLALQTPKDGLKETIKKLSDAAFFLAKTLFENGAKKLFIENDLNLISDLVVMISYLHGDLKKKSPG